MTSRRAFLAIAMAVAGVPLGGVAQPATATIGFLRSTPTESFAHLVTAFRAGLKDADFVEGQNVTRITTPSGYPAWWQI